MRIFLINFLIAFLISSIINNISYASLEEQDIKIEVNISENFSIYSINWKVIVDVNRYYPAGSEFIINLPKNYEIISVRDDVKEVEFKIYNSSLFLYNRRDVHHGDNYRFYITIKQNYNPIYYNNTFYFRSFYSSIPIEIKLPEWASDIRVLSGKNYTIKLNSIITNSPIQIAFEGKYLEDEKVELNLEHINAHIPKMYIDKISPVLENIDKHYWNKFEEIFSNDIENIDFYLVKNEKDDWICYYTKNSISCSIGILFYDNKYITKTIIHEISHHFISKNMGDGLPPWLEEGISEKISCELSNNTRDQIDSSAVIKECSYILNNDFWTSWSCEKFKDCNAKYLSNNSCISSYGLDNLRYMFSLEIVNKTLNIEDIKKISKFFRENNIKISTSSEKRDSIALFLIYLFGRNYDELKGYKIDFDSLDKIKDLYNYYNEAKEKVEDYSKDLPKNAFIEVNYMIQNSLNNIFNGYLDKAEMGINKALEDAESIKTKAEKIRDDIENIEKNLISCYYSSSRSMVLIASQSYEDGRLDKSMEYIIKALEEKEMVDKKIDRIRSKLGKAKNSIFSIILYDKIKSIEDDLNKCKIDNAEYRIRDLEKNSYIILFLIITFIFMAISITIFYFVLKKEKLRFKIK